MSLMQILILFFAAAPTPESTNIWFYIGWLGWSILIGVLVGGATGYWRSNRKLLQIKHLERPMQGGVVGACIAIPAVFMLGIGLEILAICLYREPTDFLPDSLFITTGLATGLPRQQTAIIFQVIFAILGSLISSRAVEAP